MGVSIEIELHSMKNLAVLTHEMTSGVKWLRAS